MAFFNPLTQVAGYREAVEAETRGRDIPWLNLTETINGVEVLPFAPEHFLILSLVGSPFLVGGFQNPPEVTRFLWVVSLGFIPGTAWLTQARQWRFAANCRQRFGPWKEHADKTKWEAASKSIEAYIDGAFSDSTGGDGKTRKSYFSCMAGLVDSIASEYGWSEQAILKTPFKKLFQLFRAINLRHDPKAKPVNPSQRLISDYLMKSNAQTNEQRN